ncbi:MAG: GGDEF domain-containing protein [Pseudomonadota bacterium]
MATGETQSNDATAEFDFRASATAEPGLVIITGSSLGEYYPLADPAQIIVGRDKSCDIVLDRPSVSREHLKIQRRGSRVTIQDLGSKNGVQLDGQALGTGTATLQGGTLLRLGDATLKFLDGQSPESAYHARSYRLATRDPLTDLHNRLYFMDTLGRMLADWSRRGGTLALAVIDLDHFKRVNDDRGHEAGDRILQVTAQVLTRELRASDLIARIGGEEFAVAMADTRTGPAAEILTKINRRLLRGTAELTGGSGIGFSAGVAGLPAEAPPNVRLKPLQRRLLRTADAAMYEAKDLGRGQVVVAGTLLPTGSSEGKPRSRTPTRRL